MRRVRFLLPGALVLLAVAAVVWLAVTALQARHQIKLIQAQLPQLKADLQAGNSSAARPLIATIAREAADARAKTTGPAWWLAADIPWLGRPAQVVRGGAQAVDQLATDALPHVATAAATLAPQQLRHGHTINLQRLAAAQVPVQQAAQVLDAVRRRADALPSSTWLGAATSSRNTLVHDVDVFASDFTTLSGLTEHLPSMLGAHGTRRYVVIFENEAESRGLGGLPGAFAILQADHGTLSFTQFASDSGMAGGVARGVHLAPGTAALYDGNYDMTGTLANATMSPDFPTDARVIAAMAADKFHEHFDGVIATDPTALSYVLHVTGPVRTQTGLTLTSTNLVSELESRLYQQYATNNLARKAALVDAARASATALLAGQGGAGALATALGRAVGERRLLAYSSNPSDEAWLSKIPFGGAIPRTPSSRPFSAFVVANGSGSKMDYYLQRSVDYRRTTCAASTSETTATLRLASPSTPLPDYVTQLHAQPTDPAGYEHVLAFAYATAGAHIKSVTVNGTSVPFTVESDSGHPVAALEFGMDPRKDYKVSIYVQEPAADGPLLRVVQPLVQPEHDTITGPRC